MDYQVVLSPSAREDLRDLVTYIAADNPSAAERIGMRIISESMRLGGMPKRHTLLNLWSWTGIRRKMGGSKESGISPTHDRAGDHRRLRTGIRFGLKRPTRLGPHRRLRRPSPSLPPVSDLHRLRLWCVHRMGMPNRVATACHPLSQAGPRVPPTMRRHGCASVWSLQQPRRSTA